MRNKLFMLRCSCGENVKVASENVVKVLCWRCTDLMSRERKVKND